MQDTIMQATTAGNNRQQTHKQSVNRRDSGRYRQLLTKCLEVMSITIENCRELAVKLASCLGASRNQNNPFTRTNYPNKNRAPDLDSTSNTYIMGYKLLYCTKEHIMKECLGPLYLDWLDCTTYTWYAVESISTVHHKGIV